MGKSSREAGKEKQQTNWKLLLVGVAVAFFGLMVLDDPIVTFRGGVEVDLRPFNVSLAAVATGIGVYFIWSALSEKRH